MALDTLDLHALKRGDEGAWTRAFEALWPLALRAAQHPDARLALDEAEEIASESLALLVAQVSTVSSVDQLRALACTIAHRRAISLVRRKSAAKRGPPPQSLDVLGENSTEVLTVSDEFHGKLPEVQFREMVLLLRQALNALDAETQNLLHDKIGLGISHQELALRHGLPIGTVCARVARGLRKIRSLLNNSPALMNELKSFLR
ncbi:MAG: sigma-70 family RNA polymerase sigma factor [Verrucomicrobiota bacterium]